MKLKVNTLERTWEFEYTETQNSKNNIIIDLTEQTLKDETNLEKDVNITFKNGIKKGTYRILVELYDEYDKLKIADYVDFIVD